MSFTIRGGVTTCDTCRQPVGPGWQAKTAHACPRGNRHEYTTALARADAQQVDAAGYCPQGHRAAGNTYVDKNGHAVCNACRRDRYAGATLRTRGELMAETRYAATVLGSADGRMDSAKTNRPTRERRTVLSTPSDLHGKEAVDS